MGTKVFDSATDLITFTRASGGTALRKISYGPELVTNGTFDTDTTGWTTAVFGGASLSATVSGGEVTISTTVSGYGFIRQAFTTVVGKVYQVTGSISSVTGGVFAAIRKSDDPIGVTNLVTIKSGAGDAGQAFVATATTTYIYLQVNAVGSAIFDNISIKEVLFDQPTGTLTLFNHPNNVPRIEYAADGAVKGLLIEEQRTNLVTYSETIQSGTGQWLLSGGSGALTQDAAASPDGNFQGVKLYEANTLSTAKFVYTSGFAASAGSITASVFVKAAERNYAALQCFVNSSVRHTILVDLTDGSIVDTNSTGAPTIISTGVENIGNGWYRAHVTLTHTSGNIAVLVAPSNSATPSYAVSAPAYAGDGASGIYIWGAQLEAGSFPTSYIPTSGATATRSADIASIPVSSFGYNQKAGAVVIEVRAEDTDNTAGDFFFQLDDGTTVNRIIVDRYTGNFAFRVTDENIGQVSAAFPGSEPDTTTTYTVAAAYKLNDFAFIRSGSILGTDTAGTVPDGITTANISSGVFNGHIKSIQYYPRKLTAAQLQELTS